MADHIERQAVLDAIGKAIPNPSTPDFKGAKDYEAHIACEAFADAAMIVEELPAANVREDVHGEWEPGNPVCPVCGESKFKGLDADIWADWQPPFCPNCGARMTGGGER